MTIIARSAESVHWYGQDGSPKYTVGSKSGSERPTTLRDARLMNLVPSVTTVLKVVAKPSLEVWKQEQLLLAALTLPKRENEPEKEYINRIMYDSKETAKSAANLGTELHESIEKFYSNKKDIKHLGIALNFSKEVCAHFGVSEAHIWHAERSFCSPKGYGGKIDLYTDISESTPSGVVLDTKSKDFGPEDKVLAYDENLMQLVAYRMGLNLPKARCANVFVSRTHPGLVKVHEWEEEDLVRGWRMFSAILKFWQLKNKFGEDL